MSGRVEYIHGNGLISHDVPSGAEIIKTSDGRSLVKTDRDVIITVKEDAGRDRQIVVRRGASSQYAAYIYEHITKKVFPREATSTLGLHFAGAPDIFERDTTVAVQFGERTRIQRVISVKVPDSSDPVLCLDPRYISNPSLSHGTLAQPLELLDFTQDEDLYLQGNVNFDLMVRDALADRQTHILASFFVLVAKGYEIAKKMRDARPPKGNGTSRKSKK